MKNLLLGLFVGISLAIGLGGIAYSSHAQKHVRGLDSRLQQLEAALKLQLTETVKTADATKQIQSLEDRLGKIEMALRLQVPPAIFSSSQDRTSGLEHRIVKLEENIVPHLEPLSPK